MSESVIFFTNHSILLFYFSFVFCFMLHVLNTETEKILNISQCFSWKRDRRYHNNIFESININPSFLVFQNCCPGCSCTICPLLIPRRAFSGWKWYFQIFERFALFTTIYPYPFYELLFFMKDCLKFSLLLKCVEFWQRPREWIHFREQITQEIQKQPFAAVLQNKCS